MPTVRQNELDRGLPAFVKLGRSTPKWGSGTRIASCRGKKEFDSWKIAQEAAGRKVRRQVYRCRFCRKFHVGTRT